MELIILDASRVINNVKQLKDFGVESTEEKLEILIDSLKSKGDDNVIYVIAFDKTGINCKTKNFDVRFTSHFVNELYSDSDQFNGLLVKILDEYNCVDAKKIVTQREGIELLKEKYGFQIQSPSNFWQGLIDKRLHEFDVKSNKVKPKLFDNILIRFKDFFDALFLGWTEGLEDPKTGKKFPYQVGMNDPVFGKNVTWFTAIVALITLLGYLLRNIF